MSRTSSDHRIAGVMQWGALPVPYVAAWELERTVFIARDPLLNNAPAVFRNPSRGKGRPMFGKMDEARSRRVVVERLCQVCTRPLRQDGYVCDTPRTLAGQRCVIKEPPTCRRCFDLSLAVCPGIGRMLARGGVVVARVRDYEIILTTLQPVEGGDPALNAALERWGGVPPVGYASCALTDFEPIAVPGYEVAHA